MVLILDNIAALVIGTSIFLTLMGMQMRTTEMGIDQTSSYMMKNQAASLSTWIEEDILELGTNIDKAVSVPFENPVVDQSGNTTEFTFYRDSINTDVAPPDTMRISTRYQLAQSGYSISTGDTTTVYTLTRSERLGTGSWVDNGKSVPLISVFSIEMLDRDAEPVANPATAAAADPTAIRNTRIRFAMVPPVTTKRATISQIFYGSTLLIPN